MFFDLMESLQLLERRVAAVRKVQPLHVLHGEMRVYKVHVTPLYSAGVGLPLSATTLLFFLSNLSILFLLLSSTLTFPIHHLHSANVPSSNLLDLLPTLEVLSKRWNSAHSTHRVHRSLPFCTDRQPLSTFALLGRRWQSRPSLFPPRPPSRAPAASPFCHQSNSSRWRLRSVRVEKWAP